MQQGTAMHNLAYEVIWYGITEGLFEIKATALGYTYRTGKSFNDVKNAVAKAKKKGFAKQENEISMLETYFQNEILKKRR